jgi:hypothetical protein
MATDTAVTMGRGASRVQEHAVVETQAGFERGQAVGELLCERTDPKDPADRYTVRPWDPNPYNLTKKGLTVIAIGRRGPGGDWGPLFEQAARNTDDAERKAEYEKQAELCRENLRLAAEQAAEVPPTQDEIETQRAQRIAEGVTEGLREALEGLNG